MAREIRITVDDDEVFERMKRRKADLDLTWEEALRRGLRAGERLGGADDPGRDGGRGAGSFDDGRVGDEHSSQGSAAHGRSRGPGSTPQGPKGVARDFADRLREQVQVEVRESLASSMESAQHDLDREVHDLQSAEDAVLSFDVLPDERRYEVPLRVRMETSRDGLDVDVVAVREGKSARGTNRFDRDARRSVNEHLATGGTATLAFGVDGDAETYAVAPVCSWGRTDDDTPRVSEVDVREVVFDDA